jgi:integration host factor subunit alpha
MQRAPTMALNRDSLAASIQNQTGLPKNKAMETVESIIEIIKRTLESGEDVLISGFGKFQIKKKDERRGRNPATGGHLILRSRRVVTFKVSGKLRKRVNGGPPE